MKETVKDNSEQCMQSLLAELHQVLSPERVLTRKRDLLVYESDSTAIFGKPEVIVLPESAEEVSEVVKIALKYQVPIVPRGAGTSQSGGAVPSIGGIVLAMGRMDKILEIDIENGRAIVEAGVTNQNLQNLINPLGYWFPPDPGSMGMATIGGHVGENAGGPHCLKYGVTANHVMGLEIVMPNGEIIETGSYVEDCPGYDLTGLFTGSEGTMGIITKAIVRISPMPEETTTILALLNSAWDSAAIVSEIIGSGLIPSVLEIVEGRQLEECVDLFNLGYPPSVTAQLIIEVDGEKEGIPFELEKIMEICRNHNVQSLKIADSEEERDKLWEARRGTTAAMGRVKPDSAENDIVVPRSKLPHLVEKIKEISARIGVIIGVVIHAGDGNLHAVVPFDARYPEEEKATHQALWEAFVAAVELGGTISGEHGIGLEKREGMRLVFTPDELLFMRRLKLVFDPHEIVNAEKMFPGDIIEQARGQYDE